MHVVDWQNQQSLQYSVRTAGGTWLRELTGWRNGLRTFKVLSWGPEFKSSTHIRWLKTICNFSSKGSYALFWPSGHLHVHVCIHLHKHIYVHTHTHTHTHTHRGTKVTKWEIGSVYSHAAGVDLGPSRQSPGVPDYNLFHHESFPGFSFLMQGFLPQYEQ